MFCNSVEFRIIGKALVDWVTKNCVRGLYVEKRREWLASLSGPGVNADEFKCEYVGMTDAAKKYAAMRMFLLQRS